MKLIPEQYHELETICNTLVDSDARCITFISLYGGEGSSTACSSVAQRLVSQHKSVLVIDLNPISSFRLDKQLSSLTKLWRFDDISCQLSVLPYQGIDILSIHNLESIDSAKNKHVLNEAVIRLKQEYDYVLLDMSPALKLNRNNIPLHSLSLCSELTLVTVGLGVNDEESLCNGVAELKQAGHSNIKLLVSQYSFAPLGERMLLLLQRYRPQWPRVCTFLTNKINRQKWLFKHY
ncbi:AAA family ATPase [Pseudoalteromonas rhizosphaerae]|uniref:AAA family ATPase n=1 Tax=Pseudoalteromonas rhizosphaerae TaxID=2518973 RepID=UPI0012304EAE|nr:AAA family ATPase [Pseudoalteromonas rhizosphaerae]